MNEIEQLKNEFIKQLSPERKEMMSVENEVYKKGVLVYQS